MTTGLPIMCLLGKADAMKNKSWYKKTSTCSASKAGNNFCTFIEERYFPGTKMRPDYPHKLFFTRHHYYVCLMQALAIDTAI